MSVRSPFTSDRSLKRAFASNPHRAQWLALGLLFVVGMFSLWSTFALIENNRARTRLSLLLNTLQLAVSKVSDAEAGQRGFLLVGEAPYLAPYQAAVNATDHQLALVDDLMDALPGRRPTFDAMRQLMKTKFAELAETVELRETVGIDAAMRVVRTDQGQMLMDEIRVLSRQISTDIQEQLTARDERTVALSMRAAVGSILGNVLAAVLLVSVLQHERRERTRIEERARELALAAETSRIDAIGPSPEAGIELLGSQGPELGAFVQTMQEHSLSESDKKILALGLQARELARSVETSRIQTLMQSDKEIEALGQRARELARSVERSRIQTLNQSGKEIEALAEQARELATLVETSRMQTLMQSDEKIEALGQQARELARSVERSRVQTLNQSDREIQALGQQARDLATSVETSRIETLMQSDEIIQAMGQQARDLATSVEASRLETLDQSDKEIKALGKQARELATSVETSRIETLLQSDREIRKLNEDLEQRVLERTAQLETANKELESFSYSVSHDLRAPLRAIDGFSRIVLEDYGLPLASEGKAYLQMVRDNTRQMGQLVDDLLAFSRLGRQALAKHSVDPNRIVRRCLEEMEKSHEGRQLDIEIGDLPSCEADPTLLKQVWTNLIANAIKYTRKQENARVEIGCRTQPRPIAEGQPHLNGKAEPEVVYFVKDNGAGFDMKYAHKLFGVFQRLHRTADYEGTGVGLAIVQRIVQRHGGRVWGEAKPNEGATFSFTLE